MISPSKKNYVFGYVPATYIQPVEIDNCLVHHARAWMPPNRPFDWLVDCPLSVGKEPHNDEQT